MIEGKLNIYNSEELRGYLFDSVKQWRLLRKINGADKHHPFPGPYFNMEDFVAQEGLAFGHVSRHRKRYQQRIMKHCFHNARCVVSSARGNLTYVEGYCYGIILPIHHAWAVDKEGGVVEVTLPNGPAEAYVGIPFDIEYVRATATDYNTSIIDRWHDGWPLLQKPLSENRHVLPNLT